MSLTNIATTVAVLSVMLTAGCDSDTQPTLPSGIDANITGTWGGPASDSTGPGQLVWRVDQDRTSFTGTLTILDTATKVTGRGALSGTVSAATVKFSMSIPAGGFDTPYDDCGAEVAGDAQVVGSSLTGTYTGVNSCTGVVVDGQIKMTRTREKP